MLKYPYIYIIVSVMFLIVSGIGLYYLKCIKEELENIREAIYNEVKQ
jgi:Ca2+-dependent lipid-binding protein